MVKSAWDELHHLQVLIGGAAESQTRMRLWCDSKRTFCVTQCWIASVKWLTVNSSHLQQQQEDQQEEQEEEEEATAHIHQRVLPTNPPAQRRAAPPSYLDHLLRRSRPTCTSLPGAESMFSGDIQRTEPPPALLLQLLPKSVVRGNPRDGQGRRPIGGALTECTARVRANGRRALRMEPQDPFSSRLRPQERTEPGNLTPECHRGLLAWHRVVGGSGDQSAAQVNA